MKEWPELYKEHEELSMLKVFQKYYHGQSGVILDKLLSVAKMQTVWGYLVPFARNMGYGLTLDVGSDVTSSLPRVLCIVSKLDDHTYVKTQGFDAAEEGMYWCAERFFEIFKHIQDKECPDN